MNDPAFYSRRNAMQTRDALTFLEKELEGAGWEGGERVLDVGCGPGNLTASLAAFLPTDAHIVGSDISEDMIDYAKSHYGAKKIAFKLLNIEGTNIWHDWNKDSFNKIFSFYCLHWISDHRQAAENMYSLLKKKGDIYLLFTPKNPVLSVLSEFCKDPHWKSFIDDFLHALDNFGNEKSIDWEDEYYNILKEAGFQDIRVKIVHKTFFYPSMESLLDVLEGVDPIIKFVPKEMKKCYSQKFAEIILKEKYAMIHPQNGKVYAHYNLAEVHARKL